MLLFRPQICLFIEEILNNPHLGVICCDVQDVCSADIIIEMALKNIDEGFRRIVSASRSERQLSARELEVTLNHFQSPV